MANARPDAEDLEAGEKLKTARRLQELFRGRFTQKDACKILRHTDWDLTVAVNFCFETEPEAIREILGEEEWTEVRGIRRNNVFREAAIANRIDVAFRQFGCQPCDNAWWQKVPQRKMVSRCKKCWVKHDPIPRELEWGWAKFVCPCGNEFHGFGAMGKTQSGCYGCQSYCFPVEIIPPFKRINRERRPRGRHSCTAQNCYNRATQHGHAPQHSLCVHPKSLARKVVEPSKPHDSSGSTVKTFLTQNDLQSEFNYEPSLADISDIDEPSDDNQ